MQFWRWQNIKKYHIRNHKALGTLPNFTENKLLMTLKLWLNLIEAYFLYLFSVLEYSVSKLITWRMLLNGDWNHRYTGPYQKLCKETNPNALTNGVDVCGQSLIVLKCSSSILHELKPAQRQNHLTRIAKYQNSWLQVDQMAWYHLYFLQRVAECLIQPSLTKVACRREVILGLLWCMGIYWWWYLHDRQRLPHSTLPSWSWSWAGKATIYTKMEAVHRQEKQRNCQCRNSYWECHWENNLFDGPVPISLSDLLCPIAMFVLPLWTCLIASSHYLIQYSVLTFL